ncbi:MFS transporter, partial [Altericroceibacterium spongiae]
MASAAMWLAIGMTTIDGSITNVALPAIGAALDVLPADSIWIVNAYQIAVMMTLLPLAALGEWIGYRKVYQAGLICFVIASVGCSLSSNLEGLAICRAFQGLGAGGVMSVNGALIRYIYPQSRVARGIGYNALVVAIASAAGPSVAAILLQVAEWPILFAINLPIGALSLLAGWRALPDETGGAKGYAKGQAVLCAAGLGMLALSFVNLAQWRFGYTIVFEAAFGVTALVVLVRKQRDSFKPMLPVDLCQRRSKSRPWGGVKPGHRVTRRGEWREGVARGPLPPALACFSGSDFGLAGPAVSEAIAFAVHLEDADVMGQAIEERACETLGSEGFGPFVEGQVAGDQGGAAFVTLGDQLEQQFGAGLGERYEAQFVDDEQFVSDHLLLEAQETPLVARLHH